MSAAPRRTPAVLAVAVGLYCMVGTAGLAVRAIGVLLVTIGVLAFLRSVRGRS